ncbi:MAG: 50S ribosomal protein L28 [Candidatus Brocadiia bacterium]|jgi:large subunit ribosomal protein L28
MARECAICGRGSKSGGSVKQRGRAKYLGGVGRRTTGRSKRQFKPNLQRVKALIDGTPKKIYACTKCIKSGKVIKAVK